MNKYSKLFATALSSIIILFFVNNSISAQDDMDKLAGPVGGVSTIAENLVYPDSAKEEGIEGKVFVVATIDTDGKVIKTEVKRSVNRELDAAAVVAIMMTAFNPAEKDGQKVKSTVTIPIQFKLDDCKENKNGTEKKS